MKKVLLLLADGFETYEAAVFIDVIGWNLIDGDQTTKLFSCGLNKELSTSFGQKFVVDYLISEIDVNDFDALAIPGGFKEYDFYKDAYHESFLEIIRQFDKSDKPIVSVCVGALPVGKSGVLKGRNATTYNHDPVKMESLKEFGVNVKNQPLVIDKNIITCWNPASAIDVAFMLLERLTSKENAEKVRKLMGFDVKNG
jgi:4-methyl-5(b-hydroxyethyl)-thiazole monophosphate biosynthesis